MISFDDFCDRLDTSIYRDHDNDRTVYSSFIYFTQSMSFPGISAEDEAPKGISRELARNLYNNLIEMFR